MSQIYLRPQWYLRRSADKALLTSERFHQELAPEYGPLLERLRAGVDPSTLDDEGFRQVEQLNSYGLLTVSSDPDLPGWELCGVNFHTAQEQFKHITVNVCCSSEQADFGEELKLCLSDAGLKEGSKLTLLVASSYHALPAKVERATLPIIVGRMITCIGPYLFPWSQSVRESIVENVQYMPSPRYKLPKVFDRLQRAWVCARVAHSLAVSSLSLVDNIVAYNMATQEHKLWPVRS